MTGPAIHLSQILHHDLLSTHAERSRSNHEVGQIDVYYGGANSRYSSPAAKEGMAHEAVAFPRRPDADRHARHGRSAIRQVGHLPVRAFRKWRHGDHRQQARADAVFRRAAGASRHHAA